MIPDNIKLQWPEMVRRGLIKDVAPSLSDKDLLQEKYKPSSGRPRGRPMGSKRPSGKSGGRPRLIFTPDEVELRFQIKKEYNRKYYLSHRGMPHQAKLREAKGE